MASQRMAAGNGYKVCGLFLGIFPGDVDFKNIGGKTTQRESGLLSYLNMGGQKKKRIHVTKKFRPVLDEIFSLIETPIQFSNGEEHFVQTKRESHVQCTVNSALNMAEIVIHQNGDTAL